NMRIKGWLGRSDESTKVKGMFVRPEQIVEIGRRHQEIQRMRLVVTRWADADQMTLQVEAPSLSDADRGKLESTLTSVTKLRGTVASVPPGSLPRDGRLISDER
ncbi:AMP-dependent synthetase, partial [Bradyrhizobium sp. AS23.2]